jgi:hypothetical protein
MKGLEFEDLLWGESDAKQSSGYAIYKGEFKKNMKHGIGYMNDYKLKEKYIGQFKKDSIEGFGRLKTSEYVYIGDFKNGF